MKMRLRNVWLFIGATISAISMAWAGGTVVIPYTETFEGYTNGQSIIFNDDGSPSTNGWWYGSSNDISYATNASYTYSSPGYPYVSGDHSNIMYFETAADSSGITNIFEPCNSNAYIDIMLKAGYLDSAESPLVQNVSNSVCQMSAYIDTNGWVNLWHGYFTDPPNDFTILKKWTVFSNYPSISSNDWIRLTISFDYTNNVADGFKFFQIRVNNHAGLTNAVAWPTAAGTTYTTTNYGGGSWFLCADQTQTRLGSLSLGGMGLADDIYVTNSLAPNVVLVTITPSVDAHGTISPSSAFYITSGDSTNFTITADLYWNVSDVLTNGLSVGQVFGGTNHVYTLNNITEDYTVHAVIVANVAASNTPHWWLAQFGLATNDVAETNDYDRDGMPAFQEFVAGTDPIDPTNVFKVIRNGIQGGMNYIKWLGGTSSGAATNPYEVYVRTNLTAGSWGLTGTVERVNGTNTWMYIAPTNSATFFHRIRATR